MPGPLGICDGRSTNEEGSYRAAPREPNTPSGKTRKDKASGKHARRLLNRHSDPIRENGGKQFGKTKG